MNEFKILHIFIQKIINPDHKPLQNFTPDIKSEVRSSAAHFWPPIARFIDRETSIAAWATRHGPWTSGLYEFIRFGVKQAWACLFGGVFLGLVIATHYGYPAHAPIARYDMLVLCAVAIQALLLCFRLETWEEARVILVFHIAGTLMEIFKTSIGSWAYPEPSLLRIGGVPLFSGFMYAAIGSYLARAWRLFHFHFKCHPPCYALGALAAAIYINFFTHHYIIDIRIPLLGITALLFGRAVVYFKVWRVDRSMPLLLGFILVALFIWIAENIGTGMGAWIYPGQARQWHMVPLSKLEAWFLLMIVSYALTAFTKQDAPVLE